MEGAMYEFRLYVAGQTPNSVNAINSFKAFLGGKFEDQYSLNVIDVLRNPELGECDEIILTPTLIRVFPPPIRKVIGVFGGEERALELLLLS
jgi:circadian clock protein KaiB